MTRTTATAAFLTISSLFIASGPGVTAFAPSVPTARPAAPFAVASASVTNDDYYFADTVKQQVAAASEAVNISTPPQVQKTKVASSSSQPHKAGPLSPVVLLSKMILGEDVLNKVRAKAITVHSDAIKSFVETANTPFGRSVLEQLFVVADRDGDGTVSEGELRAAFARLGFDWLQEKQIRGILERADADANGAIDLSEWLAEAPKTLKTNLVKLAKKNGGELGLLV
jgi:EF hand